MTIFPRKVEETTAKLHEVEQATEKEKTLERKRLEKLLEEMKRGKEKAEEEANALREEKEVRKIGTKQKISN